MTRISLIAAALAAAATLASAQTGLDQQDRPFLGVTGVGLDPFEAAELGIDGGARLNVVYHGGEAYKAGLRRNDILIECGGRKMLDFGHMAAVIRSTKTIGDTVELVILRDGQRKAIRARLGSYLAFERMEGFDPPPLRVDRWLTSPVELSAQKGKVVVLVFWSVRSFDWKLTARKFGELAEKLKDKVTFVGIHVANEQFDKQTGEAVEAYLKDRPFPGAVALADGSPSRDSAGQGKPLVQEDFRIQGLPTFIVIGADGKVALRQEGGVYLSKVEEKLKAMLEGGPK